MVPELRPELQGKARGLELANMDRSVRNNLIATFTFLNQTDDVNNKQVLKDVGMKESEIMT